MAASIVGKQVVFGISSSVKTLSDSIIDGIVQSASASRGGNVEKIVDEDGDIVTRIDHGAEDTIEISLLVAAAAVALPAKGSEVTYGAVTDIDGVDVSTGRGFIEDVSSSQSSAATTEVSLTITHTATLLADA
jgi:hypothetical protein